MREDHQLNEVCIDVEVQTQPAGLHSRTKPRGWDEKGAMTGTIVEPIKANHGEITLDLSAAAGQRQRRDKEATRRTGRQTGRGKGRGGEDSGRDVPSRRMSPLTLLSHEGGYHSRWSQGRRFFFL